MIRFLIGILALGSSYLPVLGADALTQRDEASPPPMRFEWHVEGPAERCGNACRTWISAVGFITEDTARDFEVFAKDNNVQGTTLVLDSQGGSVLAALELGRAFRRFDMTTTVGKTIVLPSNDGVARAKLSPDAACESMCVFLLLGGTRRYVPPEARVLVHMIWLGDKRKRAQEASYTAEELGLVQRDIGSIARYTVEMGGRIELLETALQVPPWEPLYALAADEIHRLRLTTLDHLSEEDISPIAAQPSWQATPPSANSNSLATVAPTHGGND
jgi:hypothetical protein